MIVSALGAFFTWGRLSSSAIRANPQHLLRNAEARYRVLPLRDRRAVSSLKTGGRLFGWVEPPKPPPPPPPPPGDPYAAPKAYLAQFHVVGRMRLGGEEEITLASPAGLLVVKVGAALAQGLKVSAIDDQAVRFSLEGRPDFTAEIRMP